MKTNVILHGNTLEELKKLPDNSIDCVITSPPYYGLRHYPEEANTVWPDGWEGQLGLEPTSDMYVEHLGLILKEIYRVLKPTGTFWLNIGDSYAGSMGKRSGWSYVSNLGNKKDGTAIYHKAKFDLPRKCLMCIPERVLFKCLEIGFILRNKIIWYKPNHLPSSVKDRLTNTWEYICLLTKKKKYYFNLDTIREPHKTGFEINEILRNWGATKDGGYNGQAIKDYDSAKAQNPSEVKRRIIESLKSKFLEYNKLASPAARTLKALMEDKLTTKVRNAIQGLAEYLKKKKEESGLTIKQLSELTGIKKTTLEHYFRTDEWFAIPDKGAWEALKPILNLGEYEEYVTEEIRSALPQPHPLGKNPGDLWKLTTEPFKEAHFATFPIKLVTRCIVAGCPPDGIVLDPFMGSGTVAVACELLNHRMFDKIPKFSEVVNAEIVKSIDWKLKWIGIEIVKEYVDMAYKRIEKTIHNKCKPLKEYVGDKK